MGRNSKRVEAWRGDDRDTKFSGRRGRKRRKQEQRVERQRRVNERELNDELRLRRVLDAKIKPVIDELCSRSECGIAVPLNTDDRDLDVIKKM